MSSLFDNLQNHLDDLDNQEEGITAFDLVDLPQKLRKLMRFMLRQVEIPRNDLFKAVSEMPEDDRISPDELDSALQTLEKQGWLIIFGEGDTRKYKVNLRRKQASKLGDSIWGKLDDKITERIEEQKKKEEEEE